MQQFNIHTAGATHPRVKTNHASFRNLLLASIALGACHIGSAEAQTATDQTSTTTQTGAHIPAPPPVSSVASLNDVIVTGTREYGTKARASATPILVISGQALQKTGQVTLRDALEQLAPSVARQALGGDTGNLTDVLTIHGLSPNHVLVLVNGKRRHTTANVQLDPGPQQGATGVDIDLIPASAIDHIEVLLDGDSAQYGSDAIAGVINIILKSSDHGGSIQTNEGRYYAGDGFSRDLAANAGAPLGKNGFINLSGEYAGQNHTDRTGPDPRTGYLDNKILGDPAYNRELLSVNAGYYAADGVEAYGFATYGHRDGFTYENYRLPSLILSTVTGLPLFPGGFSPQETISEDDFSTTIGLRGDNLLGWNWDVSSTYGADYDNIGMIDSANPSLNKATGYTPTSFHIENLTNAEWTNNVDLSRPFAVTFLSAPLTVSWGFEHRLDSYRIGAGDPDSYYGSGSQALPGLQPFSAGDHFRNSEAGYLDLGTKLTPQWHVDVAGRFEHYSDVGNTVNGKFTTRYDFNPEVAVRGSVGTGFQAPSLAEEYYTNLNVSPTGASGQLAPDSPIARSLGSLPLKPEKSTNFDVGLVLNPLPVLNFMADAYQINIRNRIVDGGTAYGETAIAALSGAGVELPPGIDPADVSASYFINGANTKTQGVDITGSYLQDLADLGTISWTLGTNVNSTVITSVKDNAQGQPALNAQQRDYLTSTTPKFKILLGGDWLFDKWGVKLNETIYGPTSDELTYFTPGQNQYSSSVFYHFTNPVAYTTDLEISYHITPRLEIAGGANNLFDAQPKSIPLANQYLGIKYDISSSQIGIDGGFYYARLRYVF